LMERNKNFDDAAPLLEKRVVSVDVLRGFSMFWILGGDGLARAIQQMSADSGGFMAAVGAFLGRQLTHVDWEGLRFYDLIFPLFIFTTGVSIVLSLPGHSEQEGRAKAHWRVIRRSL